MLTNKRHKKERSVKRQEASRTSSLTDVQVKVLHSEDALFKSWFNTDY